MESETSLNASEGSIGSNQDCNGPRVHGYGCESRMMSVATSVSEDFRVSLTLLA